MMRPTTTFEVFRVHCTKPPGVYAVNAVLMKYPPDGNYFLTMEDAIKFISTIEDFVDITIEKRLSIKDEHGRLWEVVDGPIHVQ